jgi:hypothetical protein
MDIEKMRKLAFGCNIGAIGFISGMTISMAIEGRLTLATGVIFLLLIIANAFAARGQW